MYNYKKLLVIGLSIILILPLIGLSACVKQQSPTLTASSPTPTSTALQLAFAGNRNGKYALFVINIDGSGETQITSWPDDDYKHPSWSPDGSMLAAQRLHSWAWVGEKWSIVTINLNSGTLNDLTGEAPVIQSVLSPVFSPYGNLIICNGTGSFTTVNLGGVTRSIITSVSGNFINPDNPSISPDTTKIVFDVPIQQPSPTPTTTSTPTASGGDGLDTASGIYQTNTPTTTRIAVVDFEGTNFTQLTTGEGTYNDAYPSWSPDGKQIAFMSDRTGKNQIYVMNADGTVQTRITNDSFANHDPAWSPDGVYIAYVSDHSGISELCIIKPDGTGRTRINRVAEMVQTPAWRPLQGKVFNGLQPPPTISVAPTSPTQTTVSTTGQLFISTSGTGENYSIYVNGAVVGQNWTNLTLTNGSYRVTIYNRDGTKVYDQMSTVIAGKTSQVKLSGLN